MNLRDRVIKIRVTEAEAQRWRTASGTAGHATLSSWVRGLAELSAVGGVDARQIRAEIVGLRTDLARGIGNNLNQIAHRLNSGGSIYSAQIADALKDVTTMRERLGLLLAEITPRRSNTP